MAAHTSRRENRVFTIVQPLGGPRAVQLAARRRRAEQRPRARVESRVTCRETRMCTKIRIQLPQCRAHSTRVARLPPSAPTPGTPQRTTTHNGGGNNDSRERQLTTRTPTTTTTTALAATITTCRIHHNDDDERRRRTTTTNAINFGFRPGRKPLIPNEGLQLRFIKPILNVSTFAYTCFFYYECLTRVWLCGSEPRRREEVRQEYTNS